jgi:uncharacterized protein with GYD domain
MRDGVDQKFLCLHSSEKNMPSQPKEHLGVEQMAKYMVLSRLTAEGRETLKIKPERLREVNKEIERMGAKVVEQYALLGKYDFLNILEAPDNETVLKVMVELGARGTLETVTMPAMPVEEFLRALK